MLAPPASTPDAIYFHPKTKCCTYVPDVPNFLAGRILSESDRSMVGGRAAVETRIARRVAVKPSRIDSGNVFSLLYEKTPAVFGRAPALRCPYLSADGECGVWKHRPGVCATWYCKHVRGKTGFHFWKLADELLRKVEEDLAYWCMAQLQVGLSELGELADQSKPHVSELDGDIDWPKYRRIWGDWAGREIEFYQACAGLVESLTWQEVQEKCGPRVEILAGLVRDAYTHLESSVIPESLRMKDLHFTSFEAGNYKINTYSPFDPLLMSERLAHVLRYFDGRSTENALQAILVEQNIRMSPELVRRLWDFGILEAWEPNKNLFSIVS